MRPTRPLAVGIALLGSAWASPPGLGSVRVTVLDATGTPQPTIQVVIVGTALGAITSASGVAVFSNVPPGSYTFRAIRAGSSPCAWRRDVVVPPEGTLEITISCADVVEVPNAMASPLIGVLDLSIGPAGGEVCKDDLVLTGTGRFVLPDNGGLSNSGGTPCHVGALLLASDRAPLYANSGLPWTPALGDVYAPTMAGKKLQVAIRIFISDPSLTAAQKTTLRSEIRDAHLALAGQVLDDSYGGIALVDDEVAGGDPQIVVDGSVATLLAGGCLAANEIRAKPSIYDANRINVYYIKSLSNESGGTGMAGYTCGTSDAPNIIFVDSQEHAPYTLVHEIGHALGLYRPDWGHSKFYDGFYSTTGGQRLNVMAETDELPTGARYLSVGQIANVHLGVESWLNRANGAGSSVRTRQPVAGLPTVSTSCGCPETQATADCAALSTDISRPGLVAVPGPPGLKYACVVTATTTTTSICKDKSTTMDAQFFTSGGVSTSTGSSLWVSLNPSIVKAESLGNTGNVTHGKLTGLTPGTATVRAYVDGSFATITVTVNPPC
jgi:hypothetical protein